MLRKGKINIEYTEGWKYGENSLISYFNDEKKEVKESKIFRLSSHLCNIAWIQMFAALFVLVI